MSTIRATTNGVLKSYRSNLYSSSNTLTKARDTVLSQRNFSSFGEDPAAATQAFQLRRSWHRTDAQYTVNQSTTSKFNTAWSTLENVSEMIDTDASNSALTAALAANSDSTAAGRNALGAELSQLADSIVQAMNSRYGDNFLFSGADGQNVSFTWSGNTLLYRGIDVSASANATATMTVDATTYTNAADLGKVQVDGKKLSDLFTATREDGSTIDLSDQSTDTLADGEIITLTAKNAGALTDDQNTDLEKITGLTVTDGGSDYEKLVALSNEANYVDIGLGLQLDDDGKVISSSAFNDSLPGINYLGYGVDEDGDSKNIAVLLKRMGELLSNCDANGNWNEDTDADEFNRLIGKLEDASNEFKSSLVQLDTKASFLSNNSTQLLTTADTINEQFLEIEQCDLADAITSYSWAQYCYNAALKVGNSLLSQSLIDYMD